MRRILPVVGVVVLVLVLGFVVLGSCSGSSKADKYRSYVQDVNSVARQSNADAKTLDAALYNQELTPDQVTARIASLIPRASAAETTAASLKPVGEIKKQGLQRYLLQSLQYRTLALQELEAALKKALAADVDHTGAARCGGRRLQHADRLRRRLRVELPAPRPADPERENVTDAAIVPSVWAISPELANPAPSSNGLWIDSVRDAGKANGCSEGAIGTSIDGVTANGTQLTPGGTVTTVKLRIPSTFIVTVGNHGSCPVRGIEVHLTEGNERTQNKPVKSLLPSETVSVPFPATGNPGEVKIDVVVPTVAGERTPTTTTTPTTSPSRPDRTR